MFPFEIRQNHCYSPCKYTTLIRKYPAYIKRNGAANGASIMQTFWDTKVQEVKYNYEPRTSGTNNKDLSQV